MIGVQTTQYKLPADDGESWRFYYHIKDLMEYDGTEVRMYTENNLLVIEYDSVFDTKEYE